MSPALQIDFARFFQAVEQAEPVRMEGEVVELVGLVVESRGPVAAIGDFCEILTRSGRRIRTQVIGFRAGKVLSMPLEDTGGLCLGDRIVARGGEGAIKASRELLGRVLDGFGNPMDGGARLRNPVWQPLYAPPRALSPERTLISACPRGSVLSMVFSPVERGRGSGSSAAVAWAKAPCSDRWRDPVQRALMSSL